LEGRAGELPVVVALIDDHYILYKKGLSIPFFADTGVEKVRGGNFTLLQLFNT
jgi:hypothetical protein